MSEQTADKIFKNNLKEEIMNITINDLNEGDIVEILFGSVHKITAIDKSAHSFESKRVNDVHAKAEFYKLTDVTKLYYFQKHLTS